MIVASLISPWTSLPIRWAQWSVIPQLKQLAVCLIFSRKLISGFKVAKLAIKQFGLICLPKNSFHLLSMPLFVPIGKTKQLVETEAVDYDAGQAKADIAEATHRVEWFPESHRPVASDPTGAGKPMIEGISVPSSNPMKVVMTGDRIEVMALLSDAEAVDKLIAYLEANKPLLPAKPKPNEPIAS